MKVSDLKRIVAEAKRQRDSGKISQAKYDQIMERLREHTLYHHLEDPVWEKPLRPVTPPRANKKSAKHRLHIAT